MFAKSGTIYMSFLHDAYTLNIISWHGRVLLNKKRATAC